MSTIVENTPFVRYSLSQEEVDDALILSPLQRQYLQTIRSEKAEAKLRLVLDTHDVGGYAQQEAYLTGQIELLEGILSGVCQIIVTTPKEQ